ncbi:hypothetical protein ACP4OV_017151 [Aristida adscensionis]
MVCPYSGASARWTGSCTTRMTNSAATAASRFCLRRPAAGVLTASGAL